MAVKQYDIQHFTAKVNGQDITFRCYTTDTRSGFCHTAICTTWGIDTTPSKVSYYNRTWERFEYETVLKSAINKLPKDIRQQVYDQIIDHKAAEEERKAEEQIAAFEKLHNGLTQENKERLANSGIEIRSEGDAQAVMRLMTLMTMMQ